MTPPPQLLTPCPPASSPPATPGQLPPPPSRSGIPPPAGSARAQPDPAKQPCPYPSHLPLMLLQSCSRLWLSLPGTPLGGPRLPRAALWTLLHPARLHPSRQRIHLQPAHSMEALQVCLPVVATLQCTDSRQCVDGPELKTAPPSRSKVKAICTLLLQTQQRAA